MSTRALVQTGDGQTIGGFIITAGNAKQVGIRGIGPSLSAFGITNALADPVIELHNSKGVLLLTNDNWRSAQEALIKAKGLAPGDDRESVLITTLDPGDYTVILSGKNSTTGAGLVEIYDLDPTGSSRLGNVSTRASVLTGDDVVIGGVILGVGSAPADIIVRGLGPSLTQFGLTDVLADPTLELRDSNGGLILSDDNWQDDPAQAAMLKASKLAPTNSKEAALEVSLAPGHYTATLAGKDGGTGIGIVEVYNHQ